MTIVTWLKGLCLVRGRLWHAASEPLMFSVHLGDEASTEYPPCTIREGLWWLDVRSPWRAGPSWNLSERPDYHGRGLYLVLLVSAGPSISCLRLLSHQAFCTYRVPPHVCIFRPCPRCPSRTLFHPCRFFSKQDLHKWCGFLNIYFAGHLLSTAIFTVSKEQG